MISVIIPAYNCAKYIERCVESVLNQTYSDFEIIAVNDGSQDGTLDKLLALAARDSRIHVIDSHNRGVVMTRKAAVKVATGEYLTFLDADDYMPSCALAAMIEPMQRENADICVGGYTLEWENTGRRVAVNHVPRFSSVDNCMRYCLQYGEMFLPIKLYRTEIFRRTVDIPTDVILQEDTIGLTQYLEHTRKVTSTNQCVYIYYKHAGTATTNPSEKHIRSLLTVAGFLFECSFAKSIPRTLGLYRTGLLTCCLSSKTLSNTDRQKVFEMLDSIPISIRIEYKVRFLAKKLEAKIKTYMRNFMHI